MVRSLWSAATGMNAQQTNVDTISNNLANVNTTGYKAQVAQFKSLLYQELQTVTTTANGDPKPVTSQVGLGTRTSSINQLFKQGSYLSSDNPSALAIGGDGFFSYLDIDGTTKLYTRNGNFTWALQEDKTTLVLTTAEGNKVLSTQGTEITVPGGRVASRITIDSEGKIFYPDEQGVPQPVNNQQIGLWQFRNREGLERVGSAAWKVTDASGQEILENGQNANNNLKRSEIVQGYLEGSNVNVANEMVNLIVAQRAYEMNSTAIQTTDEMMQTANSLKR